MKKRTTECKLAYEEGYLAGLQFAQHLINKTHKQVEETITQTSVFRTILYEGKDNDQTR